MPGQADRLTGLRFFNAAVFGATPEDYLAIYRLFNKIQGAPPKFMIVGIDTVSLRAGVPVAEDLSANYALMSQLEPTMPRPWLYAGLFAHYFRIQTFIDFQGSLTAWKSPKPPKDVFLSDGQMVETAAHLGQPLNPAGIQIAMKEYYEFHSISRDRMNNLELLLQESAKNGTRVLIWFPPVHPNLAAVITTVPGLSRLETTARQQVAALAQTYQVPCIDLTELAAFNGDSNDWLDYVHVGPTDAQRELNTLLAQKNLTTQN